uniref:Uncharacterized protein n=1 Tax=Anser cygnoides TaxID=8845 RepID=A0A8B9IJ05_ANSCY
MGLKSFWKSYKVLIVMGAGLGLVHWGWFHIKSSPIFQVKTENFVSSLGSNAEHSSSFVLVLKQLKSL